MTNQCTAILLFSALSAAAQGSAVPQSPAEQKITSARRIVESRPALAQGYVDLAQALASRARETSDPAYYLQAEAALKRALQIEPGNFSALKLDVWILLGKHEFARALEKATALNKRMPDDVLTYGFLSDAYVELGNYKEAEKATQWMLDLRPGNVPALTRTARLRELFGDAEGAVEALNMAARSTPPSEVEDRAWLLVQVGDLRLMEGRLTDAGRNMEQALALFPNYALALGGLAKVRMAEKRYDEAIRHLQQQYRTAPQTATLFALGQAFAKAGNTEESSAAYVQFEKLAKAQVHSALNSNRELALYYVDVVQRPSEALKVAKLEMARRPDVRTLDKYAWALQAEGEYAEARRSIEQALEPGIQDPEFFYHAGVIAMKQGERTAAEGYLQKAMILAPYAELSRKLLAQLRP